MISTYANIYADIILGKNAAEHLPFIKEGIDNLNKRIEETEMAGNDPTTFEKLGYRLYKMKDDAERLIAAGN